MKLPVAFILALALFISCENSTERQWLVQNRSAAGIKVSLITRLTGDTLYHTIEPGSSKVIYTQTQPGGSSGVLRALSVFDTAVIENTTGRFMQKDFLNQINWNINITQEKKFPSFYSHQYTFTVSDSDF
jgi:hypothetical protein